LHNTVPVFPQQNSPVWQPLLAQSSQFVELQSPMHHTAPQHVAPPPGEAVVQAPDASRTTAPSLPPAPSGLAPSVAVFTPPASADSSTKRISGTDAQPRYDAVMTSVLAATARAGLIRNPA
jgi:hypothetical protein